MLRYLASAVALKTLSLSPSFYRQLGNSIGARRRENVGLRPQYLERAREVLAIVNRYNIKDGDHLLELGTGWVHWESLLFRLFRDVEVVLYDVWDNRQLLAFKKYCAKLDELIDNYLELKPFQSKRVRHYLRRIRRIDSFDELYELLNWKYVLEPSGKLCNLPEDKFDLVYSVNVAEHIDRHIVPEYVKDIYRVLKPGGLSIQAIDLKDHLVQYAPGVPVKNYLQYSDRTWKMFFENRVQYFNRIQPPEWRLYFGDAGFELVDDFSEFNDLKFMNVHRQYQGLQQQDIDCVVLKLVHRKRRSQLLSLC